MITLSSIKSNVPLKNLHLILVTLFAVLLLGLLLGIRFENIYVNKLIAIFIYVFFIYLFVFILTRRFEKKSTKIGLAVLSGLVALGSLLPIAFNALGLYFTVQNGSIDHSFEEVRTLPLNSSKVVVYQTGGGATTDLGVVVRKETPLLPGIIRKRNLFSVYHASDVELSINSSDSIKVDSINFTSPQHKLEYLNDDPEVVDGQIIEI